MGGVRGGSWRWARIEPGWRGRAMKPLPLPAFGTLSDPSCPISPRQKKSKISASRKLQLKVRMSLERAP